MADAVKTLGARLREALIFFCLVTSYCCSPTQAFPTPEEVPSSLLQPRSASTVVKPRCRTEQDWYSGGDHRLNADDCQNALQLLKDTDAHRLGYRDLFFSAGDLQYVEHQPVPRFYETRAGKCVLTILMRDSASLKDTGPDGIARASPLGLDFSDGTSYSTLAREAQQVLDECVEPLGQAGWRISGEGHSLAVLFWEKSSAWDLWARHLDGVSSGEVSKPLISAREDVNDGQKCTNCWYKDSA
ncbi:MAG: hypothetical protein Q9214_005436 [Letrouitia sp. 1 TL-2023]